MSLKELLVGTTWNTLQYGAAGVGAAYICSSGNDGSGNGDSDLSYGLAFAAGAVGRIANAAFQTTAGYCTPNVMKKTSVFVPIAVAAYGLGFLTTQAMAMIEVGGEEAAVFSGVALGLYLAAAVHTAIDSSVTEMGKGKKDGDSGSSVNSV